MDDVALLGLNCQDEQNGGRVGGGRCHKGLLEGRWGVEESTTELAFVLLLRRG